MCLGIVSVSRETRSFVLRCIKVDSMFHVKHGLLFYDASKWIACFT